MFWCIYPRMMCRFWCLFVLSLAICTNIGYGWDTNWDDPFQFSCPRGESFSQVESEHNNSYEDRRWKFGCRHSTIVRSCRWSGKYCIKGGRGILLYFIYMCVLCYQWDFNKYCTFWQLPLQYSLTCFMYSKLSMEWQELNIVE